ncbi:hypothetical protein [Pedobacter sp. GR22-10]|uniref:hypothetical protein n=1 Tax=Pedobacter TaxID=84567 RepID=UPI0022463FBC|nr:hypothetical protein [Pedobacter sp. GR22-10]MCX2431476.1 hypothetical protein [Pedobacter sp. GR22-10]
MKRKFLLWIIPLFSILNSCKKQENSSLKKEDLLMNSEIVGNWVPTKVLNAITDKNGTTVVADSSVYVKSYTLGYLINKDFLVTDNRQQGYKLTKEEDQYFLEYSIFDIPQKIPILSLKENELVLQRKEIIGSITKTETTYYKK